MPKNMCLSPLHNPDGHIMRPFEEVLNISKLREYAPIHFSEDVGVLVKSMMPERSVLYIKPDAVPVNVRGLVVGLHFAHTHCGCVCIWHTHKHTVDVFLLRTSPCVTAYRRVD